MIKRDAIVVLISTAFGVGVISLLSFFIFWISFTVDNPQESIKDALEFAVGIFSGSVTFGAAIIAAHLFNDWRLQHNKQVQNQISLTVYDSFISLSNKINELANDLSSLEILINTYGQPLPHEAFYRDGNAAYLTNVKSRSSEADLIFHEFLLRLKTLLTVLGQMKNYENKHNLYFEKFTDLHNYRLKINYIQDEINKAESILIGYRDLLSLLRSSEIDPILKQLQAN